MSEALAILPLERAVALPATYYVDPRWLDFERLEVLQKSWQLLGPASWAQAPGDHFIADIAGVSVLVARDEAGTLRAFLNICRHRGAPIVSAAGRGAKRFNCPYHGWSYRLDGALRAAPEMGEAQDFKISDYGLRPVRAEVWMGLVFATLSGETPPLADFLGGVAERMAPYDLSAMRFHARSHAAVAANWKVYADNYLEGYHVPSIHPKLNTMIDVGGYATELHRWRSVQVSGITAGGAAYGGSAVYYWLIWPNTMLNVVEGRLQTNRILPDGPDRCVVEFDFYYAEDAAGRVDADIAVTAEVQDEDRRICEAVQNSLESGRYVPGRLSPSREAGVWHFQNLMREAYARAGLC